MRPPRNARSAPTSPPARGNREITRRLVLSERTVRNHVASILAKLQVQDRAAAVAKARAAGLGKPD